jgi:hypothetical protein
MFLGVSVGIRVGAVVAVIKVIVVAVGRICAVSVGLAARIGGVAVTIEGVLVGGRNGVGWLNGPRSITQPLQDVIKNIMKINRKRVFISSPPYHCTPRLS